MQEADTTCGQEKYPDDEEPIGYQYRNEVGGLGIPRKEYYSQPSYRVTIVVQSPEFSCTVTGRSRQSIAAAHENAWFTAQTPMAERLNRP